MACWSDSRFLGPSLGPVDRLVLHSRNPNARPNLFLLPGLNNPYLNLNALSHDALRRSIQILTLSQSLSLAPLPNKFRLREIQFVYLFRSLIASSQARGSEDEDALSSQTHKDRRPWSQLHNLIFPL